MKDMWLAPYIPEPLVNTVKKIIGSDTLYQSHLKDILPESLIKLIWRKEIIYSWIKRNKASKIMEIGVANGNNAKLMIEVAKQGSSKKVSYFGFDLFEEDRPKEEFQGERGGFSKQRIMKKLRSTGADINLFKGNTRETLPHQVDKLPKMDLIFIDGGHSFKTVKNDWKYSKRLVKKDSAIFFDDYSFKGVNKLINNIKNNEEHFRVYKIKNNIALVQKYG